MANDPTMQTTMMWIGIKVAMWIVILIVARLMYLKAFRPWYNSRVQAAEGSPARPFPFFSAIFMGVLILGGWLFTTYEPAYRPKDAPSSTAASNLDRAAEQRGRDAEAKELRGSSAETLDQKRQRMLDESKKQNEAAKSQFANQPK